MGGEFWPVLDRTWFFQPILAGGLIVAVLIYLAYHRRQARANRLLARGRQVYQEARYAEAEALYREALACREKASGVDNHWTSVIVNSLLGLALQAQARNGKAEAAAFASGTSIFRGETRQKSRTDASRTLSNLGTLLKTTR